MIVNGIRLKRIKPVGKILSIASAKTEADLDVQLVTFLIIEPGFPLLNGSKLISLHGGRKPRPPMGQRPYLPSPYLQLGQPIDPKVSKVV